MPYNEADIMREIHAIREKNYERTKDMSPEERCRLRTEETADAIKKYGLTVAPAQPPNRQVRVG